MSDAPGNRPWLKFSLVTVVVITLALGIAVVAAKWLRKANTQPVLRGSYGQRESGEFGFNKRAADEVRVVDLLFRCPVCGFRCLAEEPDHKNPSYDICPCCGIEFGIEDSDKTWQQLRAEWVKGGMKWYSSIHEPPENWNPKAQIERLEKEGWKNDKGPWGSD